MASVTIDSSGRLFIGTEAGGVFESSNRGDSWFARNTGLTSFHIRELQSSPRGYVFAVTPDAGIFRFFRDDVPHWTPLPASMAFGASYAMAAAPNGQVFLGTAQFGIVTSLDNGDTWSNSRNGFDSTDRDIRALTASAGRLLALTVFRNSYHLYISSNSGAFWSKLSLDPSGGAPTSLLSLTPSTGHPQGVLFYGDAKGNVFRSITDGATWERVYSEPSKFGIYNIVNEKGNGHLFLRTNFGDLLRSVDTGSSWQIVGADSVGGSIFSSAIGSDGTFYLGTDFEGVMRSVDEGATFVPINQNVRANLTYEVAVDRRNKVYAITEEFLWRSDDRGETWHRSGLQMGEVFVAPALAIDSANVVYLGKDSGVWVSQDSGEHWSRGISPTKGQPTDLCFALATGPGDTVWAATQNGLAFSANHGRSWSEAEAPLAGTAMKGIVAGKHRELYAETQAGNLYISVNSGASWLLMGASSGLADVAADGTLFSLSGPIVSRSLDSAVTWQQLWVPDSVHKRTVFSILLDSKNDLIATTDSGVYLSNDHGITWSDASSGLQDITATRLSGVTKVAEDPSSHVFYAASRGQAVFRSLPYLRSDVAPTERVSPITSLLLQSYPNPFATATTLSYRLRSESDVTVEMRDALGKVAYSTVLRNVAPGIHTIDVEGATLPNGVYRCTVRSIAGSATIGISLLH